MKNTVFSLLILLISLVVTYDFIFQMDFLIRSENPMRNIGVFAFVWCLSIISILVVCFSGNKVIRSFWALIFSVSVFFQLLFYSIFEQAFTLGDARKFWIERSESAGAFIFYWSEAIVPLVITLIFVACFSQIKPFSFLQNWRLSRYLTLFLPLSTIGIISILIGSKGAGAGLGFPGVYTFVSLVNVAVYDDLTSTPIPRDTVNIETRSTPIIKNIIVVVDESVSGDFISFNPIDTLTPQLLNQKGVLNFGSGTSAHNCSSYSNAVIRWGVSSDSLDSAMTTPTIWQYAQQSGFETHYVDAQKQPGTLSNFMDMSEIQYIDNVKQFNIPQVERDPQFMASDLTALSYVANLLKGERSQFIYMNKLGVHFPFEGKYPQNSSSNQPTMGLFQPIGYSSKEELLNSYKNALAWNVGNFFEYLFKNIDLTDTVVIYTSDHGQNLLDQGKSTHCSSGEVSGYQSIVPFVLLTENEHLLKALNKNIEKNHGKLSHFNIFPTLLYFMGYEGDAVQKTYGASIFEPVDRLGKFAKGNLFSQKSEERAYDWQAVDGEISSRLE